MRLARVLIRNLACSPAWLHAVPAATANANGTTPNYAPATTPVSMCGSEFAMKHRASRPQAYGKTAYLITTLKVVPRGTEGAVSLEGTAAGIAAAGLFSGVALALKQVQTSCSVLCNTPRSWILKAALFKHDR